MGPIVYYTLFVFAIAGIFGYCFNRSPIWRFTDAVLYPLTAIGVVLLFANNSAARRVLELRQLAEQQRSDLRALVSAKPDVRVMTSTELMNSSFNMVAGISQLGEVCNRGPLFDPQCSVAKKLKDSVDVFIKTTQGNYPSDGLRLSASCSAATKFLDDIRAGDKMSSLVGDELIAQYKTAVSKNYQPLDYESVNTEAREFEQRALAKIESVRKYLSTDDSESMRFVFSTYQSEVDFGKTILVGLFPCIVAPKDLDLLTKWTVTRQSKEEQVNRLEEERKRVGASEPDPWAQWIQLNLWPFVLVSAGALQFAKATSAMRKPPPIAD